MQTLYRWKITGNTSGSGIGNGTAPFWVYDEPSTDLCLHKNLYLANVHYQATKWDGVQSIQIE